MRQPHLQFQSKYVRLIPRDTEKIAVSIEVRGS